MKSIILRHVLLCGVLLMCFVVNASAYPTHTAPDNVPVTSKVTTNNQGNTLTLKGKLIDESTGDALPQAVVQLYQQADSTYVAGGITDLDGVFRLPKLSAGKYYVKLTYIGMEPFLQAFQLLAKQQIHDLGVIKMQPDCFQLQETVIVAEAPRMVMKEDTAVYSSAAYNVPEGSMVEELIKRLPGAEIDEDGKITINGREITKILVDGKEFFLNDPEVALKNLPVEMIQHISSYERESDMARATGVKDGEEEQVLDLKIKPQMKKGWLGNLDVAKGSKDRYLYKGMLNRFYGDDQMTVLYNKNNVNDKGLGGGQMSKSMIRKGKLDKQRIGVDFRVDRNKIDINGSVNGTFRDQTKNYTSDGRTYYSSGTRFWKSTSRDFTSSKDFRGNMRVRWNPDSLTSILIRPSFSLNSSDRLSASHSINSDTELKDVDWNNLETRFVSGDTFVEDTTQLVYQKYGMTPQTSDRYNFGLSAQVVRRSARKAGRSLALSLSGGVSGSENDRAPQSHTFYYRRTDNKYYDKMQRLTTDNGSYNYRARVSYNEPIMEGRYLQFAYSYNHKRTDTDKHVYELPKIYDELETEIDSLGKKYYNNYDTHDYSVSFRSVGRQLRYNVGLKASTQVSSTHYNLNNQDYDRNQTVTNFSPYLDLRWKFSKKTVLRMKYRGRTQQPPIDKLMPITDYSNPVFIREGNPDLKPAFSQQFQLQYTTFLSETQQSYMTALHFTTTANGYSDRRDYNEETGVTTSKPMNINGRWRIRANYAATIPFKNRKWTTSWNGWGSYDEMPSYQYIHQVTSKSTTKRTYLNQRGKISYRNEAMEIGLGGSIRYIQGENDVVESSSSETFDYVASMNAMYTLPFGLTMALDGNMVTREGYEGDENGTDMVVNGQLSYSMLNGKRLTFSLQAMDMLQEQSTTIRTVYSTGDKVADYDVVSSYVMFHVLYRFNIF